jgi:hypothetical protein
MLVHEVSVLVVIVNAMRLLRARGQERRSSPPEAAAPSTARPVPQTV